jgi:cytosine permease
MARVAYVIVPTIVIIGAFAITKVAIGHSGSFGFEPQISLQKGISLVVGTWIMGAITCMPDMTRFARSAKAGAVVAATGIMIANSFTLLIGAAGAALAKQSDPAQILLGLGFIWPGIVFGLANIWTTNDSNIYSASLNLATVLGISRRQAVIICMILGGVFAATQPYRLSFLFDWLLWLGKTAPALGAIVLVKYWLVSDESHSKGGTVTAWIAWLAGVLAATFLGGDWAVAVGFFVSILVYLAGMKLGGYQIGGRLQGLGHSVGACMRRW